MIVVPGRGYSILFHTFDKLRIKRANFLCPAPFQRSRGQSIIPSFYDSNSTFVPRLPRVPTDGLGSFPSVGAPAMPDMNWM
jgi:hypothetical protein